ncbi:MAG: AtpZ/AtpI family protein [Candidatus Sericytochromatia bacterium]|uniref:AtpZ/AtpI family protein n=1 Tax=Candidatus Tanganyikabacteria bacterium TaxID=2961651 RepID=A0A937X3U5_9BACT|nr:AtpZ/AtpI family protein [Candidatus Tanganyikabacteria bacterium]
MGILLDQRFGTTPWCMFGGLLLGFTTGLVSIFRLLKEPPSGE